jgi:acyl carrier protein
MELQEFLKGFANQFDDTDASEINENTNYRELEEWSSLTGMSVIAFVRTQYGKTLTGEDIRRNTTVKELFEFIAAK